MINTNRRNYFDSQRQIEPELIMLLYMKVQNFVVRTTYGDMAGKTIKQSKKKKSGIKYFFFSLRMVHTIEYHGE